VTPSLGPYVPPEFIPEEDQVLGEPEHIDLGPEISLDDDNFSPGEQCSVCDGPMMELESGEKLCLECKMREPGREGPTEAQLRRWHNDGSFMPIPVSDWYEGGDRR